MSSIDAEITNGFGEEEKNLLRQAAKNAVEYKLQHGTPLNVDTTSYPLPLRKLGASFVTLKKHGELRGCIGTLEAHRPLVEDVTHNAHAAAFTDPRFPPVSKQELPELEYHLSVLTPATPMRFESEKNLLEQIRPGIDGLVLKDGSHRSTFLPAVWESLPDAVQFLQHLKLKAGLPKNHWSNTLKISRYTTESF